MAYNVLMNVDDLPAVLREARRVMKPEGALFISLVHPFRDRGCFSGPEPDAAFILDSTYYGRERFEGEEEHNGLRMRFAGWSRLLQDYVAAMEKTGLAIASLREPVLDKVAGNRLRQWTRTALYVAESTHIVTADKRTFAIDRGSTIEERIQPVFHVKHSATMRS